MEELQLRFLEKQLTTKFFYFVAKRPFFLKKWRHHQKKVIALNTYIGTNVLVYERWLVLKVRYTAGPTPSPFHRLTLLMHVSQKSHRKRDGFRFSKLWWVPVFDGTDTTAPYIWPKWQPSGSGHYNYRTSTLSQNNS